jgi:hypothetical protein
LREQKADATRGNVRRVLLEETKGRCYKRKCKVLLEGTKGGCHKRKCKEGAA